MLSSKSPKLPHSR